MEIGHLSEKNSQFWIKKMSLSCKTYGETIIFAAKISPRKFRRENFAFLEQYLGSLN